MTFNTKKPYRFSHTASNSLFAEQVAMRPGAGQRQNQHIIFYAVNEQPVRENVAFPMAHPIAGQIVIAVLFQQRSPIASSATTCSSNSIFRPRLIARL